MTDESTNPEDRIMDAIRGGVRDPEEMRRLSGLPTVAAVQRTVDKMSIRRDYHDALRDNGMTLDWMAKGIKDIADSPTARDSVRLTAFRTLLGSLGLDRMDDIAVQGKDWEETLLRLAKQDDPARKAIEMKSPEDYEVKAPPTPPEVSAMRQADHATAREMRQDV